MPRNNDIDRSEGQRINTTAYVNYDISPAATAVYVNHNYDISPEATAVSHSSVYWPINDSGNIVSAWTTRIGGDNINIEITGNQTTLNLFGHSIRTEEDLTNYLSELLQPYLRERRND